jgi:hypothetical protein
MVEGTGKSGLVMVMRRNENKRNEFNWKSTFLLTAIAQEYVLKTFVKLSPPI